MKPNPNPYKRVKGSDDWRIEAEAANKTIDRLSRENRLMRHLVQKLLDGEPVSHDDAWKVRTKVNEINEELWK